MAYATTGLDHITITAADFPATLTFYDATLGALGYARLAELVDEEEDDAEVEAVGWGTSGGTAFLWLVGGVVATSGLHVRVSAPSREHVEAFFAAGTAAGGRGHAQPRRWTPYRRGEYSATVGDPAGNLIEAVAPE